jgi:sugar lactone lactonase YvrE
MRDFRVFGKVALLLLSAILVSCNQPTEVKAPLIRITAGIVAEDASWEEVVSGHPYSDSPAADADGNIYFSDIMTSRIMKLDHDLQQQVFAAGTGMTQGLVFGDDGYLYGCRQQDAQIVRYGPDGTYEVLAQGKATPRNDTNVPASSLVLAAEFCNDLAVNPAGGVWFTDRINEKIIFAEPDGSLRTVASGFRSSGLQLSLDKTMLVATDSNELRLHAFRVGENGRLQELPDYFDPIKVYVRDEQKNSEVRSGANGMTLDSEGRFYVATFLGVQVFAPDGRHLGIIRGAKGYMSSLTFGGPDRKWLYSAGSRLSRLRMEAPGAGVVAGSLIAGQKND